MDVHKNKLIHVRTPTYKRPKELERCLESIRSQDWQEWVCDVYDDDPAAGGRAVCEKISDPRIRYTHNRPQNFASKNIDACFTKENPHNADYFCVLEDDNFLLPGFFSENVDLLTKHNINIVLRNQLIEKSSGSEKASLSKNGVLDELFVEGLYDSEQFRMSLLFGIGVSNGGVFWTKDALSELEIKFPCSATLQEYLRTFSIVEPIYVAMTSLAVWAENAENTTRNAELRSSYMARELNLKRWVQRLRVEIWQRTSKAQRQNALNTPLFVPTKESRAKSLVKALILRPTYFIAGGRGSIEMILRGIMIRLFGKPYPEMDAFLKSRDATAGRSSPRR
jgi:glycosyltransferase involved in cell wall biosynthesis